MKNLLCFLSSFCLMSRYPFFLSKQHWGQPAWIHPSDRGVQSASAAYVQRLLQAGARVRMAAKGHPYEHAPAARFFKTLTREAGALKADERGEAAQAQLATFSDEVDNAPRLPSSLGNGPPLEYAAAWRKCRVITPERVVRSLGVTPQYGRHRKG